MYTDKEIQKRVDDLLPHQAYKFINDNMTDEILEVIEKCFAKGLSEENIVEAVSDKQPMTDSMKLFFLKALQHYKFIWQVKNDLL
jgi:hypothetical protein